MITQILAILLLFLSLAASGEEETTEQIEQEEPLTLDALIESVRNSVAIKEAELKAREQRFLADRDRQAALVKEARAKRIAAEKEADRLSAAFEAGENELADLETDLDKQTGDLNDVFTVVHQIAGDIMPMIESSLVSAEIGERTHLVERLANKDTLPTAEEMRALWLLLLEEMNDSGKTTRFTAKVISPGGEEEERTVTRVGNFTAVSNGEYLRYLVESGRLLALSRQPTGANPAETSAFEESENAMTRLPIDPSRGSILALVVQRAGFVERVQQGGWIGYIILLIGLAGLVLGLERAFVVYASYRRQMGELNDGQDTGGPVAQLRQAASDADFHRNADSMSAKMDEIVATANQKLGRGLATMAIFAAVSPLLGLLGTVTGMIETFQVITLFGAGDPRLMSGGISQALITTQLGLSVAIPLLLLHSFVLGRVNSQVAILDETAASMFADAQAAAN